MQEQIMDKIMEEVMKKVGQSNAEEKAIKEEPKKFTACGLTEFVGTAIGDTIGLVIANVDYSLHEAMKIDKKYRSIGILSARTGAGPQIMAADEAVKATNTEILAIELARDTKGERLRSGGLGSRGVAM